MGFKLSKIMSLRDQSIPVLYNLYLQWSVSAKLSLIDGQPTELDSLINKVNQTYYLYQLHPCFLIAVTFI